MVLINNRKPNAFILVNDYHLDWTIGLLPDFVLEIDNVDLFSYLDYPSSKHSSDDCSDLERSFV